ncbi:hypothetical protein [Lactobacillus jensenii]|uniref:Uncharacterized protein n=1 Tax=Lactobacillus jensenii TaxID=109790 RepID=A0ABU9FJM1_LACJE|nr:hypothetical protein [Lactobacillus jensenii]MDK7295007.1 hypothetical protein [Lactobacillus jensenii]MDT9545274.1 hypothetical protein [Lactobacillus jensenii]
MKIAGRKPTEYWYRSEISEKTQRKIDKKAINRRTRMIDKRDLRKEVANGFKCY